MVSRTTILKSHNVFVVIGNQILKNETFISFGRGEKLSGNFSKNKHCLYQFFVFNCFG